MKYFIFMISVFISATTFACECNGKITDIIPYANGNMEVILTKIEQNSSSPQFF
ncbi:hypothetical protein AADZ84_13165 [Colwelliaceae bacterium MEBiC 14330]